MIINELRLKNIKSYGTGTDDNGITIRFYPGINRISGCNGSGKSTIIEAIGYALFEAKPQCFENFDTTTYFLRTGCNSGEIDITFKCDNETYRVERGLGPANKRRAKVILVDDNSICAENEKEVSSFLCRLLGFVDSTHLSEMFIKLIGIKQGYLTRPFDSKPSHAKDFFEPLLEVEIFRHCYDQIKPAMDTFDVQINKCNCLLAIAEERIRERQDSYMTVITKSEELLTLEQQIKGTMRTLISLRNQKEKLEDTAATIIELTHKYNESQLIYNLQKQKCTQAQIQTDLSRQAVHNLEDLLPSYNLFIETEAKIKNLRNNQDKQRDLIDKKNCIIHHKLELNANLNATTDHIKLLVDQIEAKQLEIRQIANNKSIGVQQLKQSKQAFQCHTAKIQRIKKDLASIHAFIANIPKIIAHQQQLIAQIVDLDKNCTIFDRTRTREVCNFSVEAEQQLQESTNQLAILRERYQNLVLQQKNLNNGLCPFVKKQQCHRKKNNINIEDKLTKLSKKISQHTALIESNRKILDVYQKQRDVLIHQSGFIDSQYKYSKKLITELQKSVKNLIPNDIAQHIASLRSYISNIPNFPTNTTQKNLDYNKLYSTALKFQHLAENWWEIVNGLATQILDKEDKKLNDIAISQYHINHQDNLLVCLTDEVEMLNKTKQINIDKQKDVKNQLTKTEETIATYTKELEKFNNISEELTKQTSIIETTRKNYLAYISIYSVGEQAQSKEIELQSCLINLESTANRLTTIENDLQAIQIGFDHQALDRIKEIYLEKSNQVAIDSSRLNHIKESLILEKLRYTEWETSCAKKNQLLKQIARIKATKKLGELARNVFKQAAPIVSQYICNNIATKAQKIFNAINGEPIELRWHANRYSLRVIPGERRFAMLSGGEQNKLALAMILAMIEEFSKLRFCIFDEPTYGIDIYSREKLAKTMLAAQDTANMEQLLIVSHDDIFESQVEHCVLLTKTLMYGTQIRYCG
jgi:exonuclease SbcC